MGMYTELALGIRLSEKAEEIVPILEYMLDNDKPKPAKLPDHELFSKPRWEYMLRCSSYYFPLHSPFSQLTEKDSISGDRQLLVWCNLKNYSEEIESFVDWIKPYAEAHYGSDKTYLGHSRYEESDQPTLYFKDND